MKIRSLALCLLTTLAAFGPVRAADHEGKGQRAVVVELFTSQGCSSCPPADHFLSDLADEEGIIALSWNVDYWDYLGWRDTFARPENTARQRAYNRLLGRSGVYTPQMVIDGRFEDVGSRRGNVRKLIDRSRTLSATTEISLSQERDILAIQIGAGEIEGEATVWLVDFAHEKSLEIKRGELAGRKMTYRNVVLRSERLEHWTGAAMMLTRDLASSRAVGADACAIIIQTGETGPIIAARVWRFGDRP